VPLIAVTVPPQVVLPPADTITPLGSVSIRGADRPEADPVELLRVRVTVEVPPAVMDVGLNSLPSVGGATTMGTTVKVATAGAALLPVVVSSAPAASELIELPAVAVVTCAVTVQKPSAGMEPADRVTLELPTAALTAPPVHVVLPIADTVIPLGNASTSADFSVAAALSGLLRVSVSVEVPPALIVEGLKDLLSVGGTAPAAAHDVIATVLESSVTAPVRAKALPDKLVSVVRVTLVWAKMLPVKVLLVPRVAELPTCQNTLHGWPPSITTEELLAVVSVLPILKTHTAAALPAALSVSVPVS